MSQIAKAVATTKLGRRVVATGESKISYTGDGFFLERHKKF